MRILKRSGFLKLWARPTCSGDPSFALSRFNGSDESFEYFGKRLRIVAEKARQTRAMDRKFAKDRRCRCERLGVGVGFGLGTKQEAARAERQTREGEIESAGSHPVHNQLPQMSGTTDIVNAG